MTSTSRLRGRDTELTVIGSHLDRLLSGVGTVVVLEGHAGMGKSRLLAEVAVLGQRLDMLVGRGVADPGDTIVQLAPLMEALFEGPGPILDRDALTEAHTSPEQRYWLLQDIEAALERAALESPVLVCLDDLQWADAGTAAALRTLPSRLSAVPVGWIIATRPGSGSPRIRSAIDQLEREGAHKVVLGPLDHAAVAQLAADLLVAEPDDPLLDMVERAGGSPFLLVELLWGLRDEHRVRIHGGKAELIDSRVPDRVGESMRRRLDRASEPAREFAIVAGSLGRRFSLDDVAAMLDVPPSALLVALDELIHDNLLIEQDGQLAFRHDLTLEAVRGSVSVAVRRALDRQAAAVLLASGALPVEVAMQLAGSAEPGDEVAIATLLKAAEAIGTTDPSAAADLGRRALELAPLHHPLRGPLVAGTAVWLHAAARAEDAKAFADTALRQVLPPAQEAVVHLSIAGMFSLSPEVRADSCRAALAFPDLPGDLRARHQALLFHNLVTAGRTVEARAVLTGARTAVQQSGDVAAQFILELAEAGLDYADGRFAHALTMTEAGLRSSAKTNDETRANLTRQWRCDVLTMADRLDETLELSSEHVALAQRQRQGWALRIFETGRARLLLQLGRLADAAAILQERVSEDDAHQISNALDAAGVAALGRVAIHLGDESSTRHVAQIAQVMLEQGAPSVRRHAAWFLALRSMAADDFASAHRWLCTDGWDERLNVLPLFPMDIADEANLVRIALRADDRELAEVACAGARHRAELNPAIASSAAAAMHTRGLLHNDFLALTRAVYLYEQGRRPLLRAAALEDLGVASFDAGQTPPAIDAFSQALALFADAGAAWDASRMRGRLRNLGVRRRLAAAHRPLSGWAALTDSEVAVARLAADGLTNREAAARLFVSHHTISGHLRSIYLKLGISSRVELTRLAALHDADA
jgi:DNA-binding CsgD family transcriptional regulator